MTDVIIYWIDPSARYYICKELGITQRQTLNGRTCATVNSAVLERLNQFAADNILRLVETV